MDGAQLYRNCEPLRRAAFVGHIEPPPYHRLPQAGGTLENAQAMAPRKSPRTTKLDDRTATRSRSTRSRRV